MSKFLFAFHMTYWTYSQNWYTSMPFISFGLIFASKRISWKLLQTPSSDELPHSFVSISSANEAFYHQSGKSSSPIWLTFQRTILSEPMREAHSGWLSAALHLVASFLERDKRGQGRTGRTRGTRGLSWLRWLYRDEGDQNDWQRNEWVNGSSSKGQRTWKK